MSAMRAARLGGFTMCRGCFNQLFLRDEFHSGGIAGLLGKAAGMPTRRAFMAYSSRRGLRASRRSEPLRLSQRTMAPTSFCAAGRSARWPARRSPPRSRSRAARCSRSATRARCRASRRVRPRSSISPAAR